MVFIGSFGPAEPAEAGTWGTAEGAACASGAAAGAGAGAADAAGAVDVAPPRLPMPGANPSIVLSGTLLAAPAAAGLGRAGEGAGSGEGATWGASGVGSSGEEARGGDAWITVRAPAPGTGADAGSFTAPHWPQNFAFSGIVCPH